MSRAGTFICRVCDAAFTSASGLAAHEGDRHEFGTFPCMWCGTEFRVRIDLRKHGPHCTPAPVETGTEYYRAPKPERKSVEASFSARHQAAVPRKTLGGWSSSSSSSSGGHGRAPPSAAAAGEGVVAGMYTTFQVTPAATPCEHQHQQQGYHGAGALHEQAQQYPPEGMELYPPTPDQNQAADSSSQEGWVEEQLGYADYQHAAAANPNGQYANPDDEQQPYWPYEYPPAPGA